MQANRLLKKAHVQQAIANQRATFANPLVNPVHVDPKAIADATERDTILTTIARSAGTSEVARIMAVRELNKCGGRHVAKVQHEFPDKLVIEWQPSA